MSLGCFTFLRVITLGTSRRLVASKYVGVSDLILKAKFFNS